MAVSLPNGSTIHISSGFGSALTVTAVTNAVPAVATSATHGLSNGDFVVFTSGWSRLSDKVFRVANVDTNTFELEGTDTQDTDIYPAGSGTGSVKKVSGWTQLTQVLSTNSVGGDQNYTTYQFLEADTEVSIPTNKSAAGLDMTVADDPSLAGYILASTANDDRLPRAVRVTAANGAKSLYYSYISVNRTPSLTVNQVSATAITFRFLNEPVRYSS